MNVKECSPNSETSSLREFAKACSEAKLAANRRNAQLSTGPKTPEGKDKSRANALTHGLCSKLLIPEDADVIEARINQVFSALKPQNEFQAWLVDHVAVCSIRIDRCERIERRARNKICLRVEMTWDEDRKLEDEKLGGMLSKRPAEIVDTLRRTPHGCDWLITRWALLGHISERQAWSEEETTLAFDLLSTPGLFRHGFLPGVVVDSEGNVVVATERPAEMARRMVAELKQRREEVRGLDKVDRVLTETDHDFDSDPELRRLRRYESTLHSKLRWAVNLIQQDPVKRPYLDGMRMRWLNSTTPRPKTADEKFAENYVPVSIHPPFDLTEEEAPPPGQKADIPAILKSRKEKRIARVDSRREARRRKLDRLRA